MLHPARRYIAATMLEADTFSEDQVRKSCENISLPEPAQSDMDALLNDPVTRPPAYLRLDDPTHIQSIRWLRKHALFSWFYDPSAMEQTLGILRDARAREQIEDLLVCQQVQTAEVAALTSRRFGVQINQKSIDLFGHYFWAVREMSTSEMYAWFSYDESRRDRASVRVEYATSSAETVLYLAGGDAPLDVKKGIRDAFLANQRVIDRLRTMPITDENVQMLGVATRSIVKLAEPLERDNNAIEAITKRFSKFRVRLDAPEPVSLAEKQGKVPTRKIALPEVPATVKPVAKPTPQKP